MSFTSNRYVVAKRTVAFCGMIVFPTVGLQNCLLWLHSAHNLKSLVDPLRCFDLCGNNGSVSKVSEKTRKFHAIANKATRTP